MTVSRGPSPQVPLPILPRPQLLREEVLGLEAAYNEEALCEVPSLLYALAALQQHPALLVPDAGDRAHSPAPQHVLDYLLHCLHREGCASPLVYRWS